LMLARHAIRTVHKCVAALLLPLAWPAVAWAAGQEQFGSAPLLAANYPEWPRVVALVNDPARVYHWWVNGNEQCYYRGDTAALNAALANFARVGAEVHEVVIRPGPGRTRSFHGKPVEFGWMLHLVGGISRHQTTLDRGPLVWSRHPMLHVFVVDDIRLDQLQVPEGVRLIGLGELKRRNVEALGSSDQTVRGWGAGHLAELDPYDERSASAIAKLLDDPDDWVRASAVSALASLGATAKSSLPALEGARAFRSGPYKEQYEKRTTKAVEEIRGAKADSAGEKSHREALRRIEEFLAARRGE
jgi:hypothetical protein